MIGAPLGKRSRPGPPQRPGRRAAGLAALLLALACDQAGRTGPRPTSISPDHGDPAAPVAVRIQGERLAARVATDFGDGGGDVLDARFQAYLGTTPLLDVQLAQDGSLTATVPAGLAEAVYDLVVVDPEGRAGTLARAYRAASGATPASVLGGIVVEVAPAQEVSRPFAVTVTVVDSAGAPVIDFDGAVALSDLTGTVVPARLEGFVGGRWSGQVEVRVAHAADVLAASAVGAMGSSGTFAVLPAPAALVAFETAPITTAAGRCAGPVSLALRDAFGEATVTGSALRLAVGPTGATPVSLFADAGCTAALPTPTVTAGQGRLSIWFEATAAGPLDLAAGLDGGAAALQREAVIPGPAAAVLFLSPPQTTAAGACSGAVTVRVEDAFGNPAPDASPVDVQVSPAGSVALFADAACTVPASTLALSSDAHVQLHFLGTVAQTVELTVSAGAAAAAQVQTVDPGAPAQLVFTTPPRTAAAGACSGAVTVASRDAYGNASPVAAETAVALSASPASGFTFYSDAACATAVTAVPLAAGAAQTSFHFRGTATGMVTVTAAATALGAGAAQTETVTPLAPTHLAFTTPARTAVAGACSAVVTVEARDAYENASPPSAATAASLSASPASGFAFYSDAACTTAVTGVTLATGASTASLYFRGTAAGAVTVTAGAPGMSPDAMQVETITAAAAGHLAFATAAQTVTAGACSGVVTVASRDAYGNASPPSAATAVALSASPASGFTFYSDAACTAAVTGVTLAAGASSASLHFRGTAAGSVTVTAGATGMTPDATQVETVRATTATHLVFTSAAQTVTAGSCSGAVTVASRDAYGNASPVTAATAVALSASPAGGFTFYSDAACTTAVTGVTLAAGASSASLHFRGTAAGAVTVTAAAGGMTPDATQVEEIDPAVASRLAFTSAPQTVAAGACSAAVALRTEDAFGNARPVAAPAALLLSSATLALYADAACVVPLGRLDLLPGEGGGTVYFEGSLAGAAELLADGTASGLGDATQPEQIAAAPASQLVYATAARTAAAGTCSDVVTLQSQDRYGNPSPVGAATAAALSAAPASGFTLYSDAACTTTVTSVTLGAGASSAGFHFRGTAAGTVTVTATAAGLGAGVVQAETVTPLAPTHLAFTTSTQTVAAGACSGVVTVEARDAYENAGPVSAATPVALSATPAAGFAFYADEDCTTAITEITLGAAAVSASFHFAGTAAGVVTLTAGAGGMAPDATQGATIRPAGANHLAFTTAAQTVVAGDCSAALAVQLEDQFGNPAPVSSATAVALTASPAAGFAFYAGARCSGASQSSVSIAAGAAATSFSFRPSTSGAYTVTAAMDGAVLPASQVETVLARHHFEWSGISSPQLSTLPIRVTVRCLDRAGNLNTSFASTAALTASSGAASCVSDWRTPVACGEFTGGVWSGWVVGVSAGDAVTLTAVSGDVQGTSAPFRVAGPAGRSPPLVRVWASSHVSYPYNYFHLYSIYDGASPYVASEDYQTPAAGLSVSWQLATLADHQAAATPEASPWSGWSAWDADEGLVTATSTVYYPRVAVRDGEPAGPDVGYGYQLVVVAPSPSDVCQVNTSSLADDGATSCTAPGPDGLLSLPEAVRLANAWTGTTTPTIYFPEALTITGVGALTLTHAVNVVSSRYQFWTGERLGPILDGAAITISASGVLVSGLELAHQTAPLTVSSGADAALHDVYIHDGAGVLVQGTAAIVDSRLARCAGSCVQENDPAARLAIHGSDFEGAGGDVGVSFDACDGTKPNVAGVTSRFGSWPASGSAFVGSTVFTGFGTAVRTSCTYSWVNSDTFYRNGIGVQGAAGYIVDGIFDGQVVSAVDSTDCSAFQALNRQIVWENASDGCLGATLAAESDTTAFSADPLFVFPEARDFRLQYGSPAKDRANAANMVDVDGPGPGLYLGAGPDRGARETW